MADTNIDDQLIVKIEKELDALERKVRRELAIHTGFNRDLYGSQKTGHEVWDFWKTQNLQKMLDLAYSYTCDHVAIDGPLAQALQRARKQATPRAADGSEDEHVASVASENHAVRRKGSVDGMHAVICVVIHDVFGRRTSMQTQ